ncbi:hypothetical protein RFI_12991 [Reticulomyxa filosa]|uniref:Uncharacterized protein n=1 Tax=Reticulomyxa filosa TaxID=46433 RepID=X6NE53_RETFI|nr:hypothetical protein RFI_12991 [Reticulomyxa filosa]|eukprot:ETO24168.1 hypothetical protein RFI_12991 [Reticulomyxa filosa]
MEKQIRHSILQPVLLQIIVEYSLLEDCINLLCCLRRYSCLGATRVTIKADWFWRSLCIRECNALYEAQKVLMEGEQGDEKNLHMDYQRIFYLSKEAMKEEKEWMGHVSNLKNYYINPVLNYCGESSSSSISPTLPQQVPLLMEKCNTKRNNKFQIASHYQIVERFKSKVLAENTAAFKQAKGFHGTNNKIDNTDYFLYRLQKGYIDRSMVINSKAKELGNKNLPQNFLICANDIQDGDYILFHITMEDKKSIRNDHLIDFLKAYDFSQFFDQQSLKLLQNQAKKQNKQKNVSSDLNNPGAPISKKTAPPSLESVVPISVKPQQIERALQFMYCLQPQVNHIVPFSSQKEELPFALCYIHEIRKCIFPKDGSRSLFQGTTEENRYNNWIYMTGVNLNRNELFVDQYSLYHSQINKEKEWKDILVWKCLFQSVEVQIVRLQRDLAQSDSSDDSQTELEANKTARKRGRQPIPIGKTADFGTVMVIDEPNELVHENIIVFDFMVDLRHLNTHLTNDRSVTGIMHVIPETNFRWIKKKKKQLFIIFIDKMLCNIVHKVALPKYFTYSINTDQYNHSGLLMILKIIEVL